MQVYVIVILITTPTLKEAKKISKALIENKKAACVNIIKDIESQFYWQNKIQKEKEVLLVIKSTKPHFKDIVRITKKYHSYKIPEIIALPLVVADNAYLNWMRKVLT